MIYRWEDINMSGNSQNIIDFILNLLMKKKKISIKTDLQSAVVNIEIKGDRKLWSPDSLSFEENRN